MNLFFCQLKSKLWPMGNRKRVFSHITICEIVQDNVTSKKAIREKEYIDFDKFNIF